MISWALVISIITYGHSAITYVPMQSQQACITAKQQIEKDSQTALEHVQRRGQLTASCLRAY